MRLRSYVLGPLVTDIFPGYDHITSAIGGAIAAANGADFLCYVTPAEHLRLPDAADVKEGIIASRIAAHAADIAKGVPHARDLDNQMAEARHRVDWEAMFQIAVDPDKARSYFESTPPSDRHTCSMCGKMCAVRTTNLILEGKKVGVLAQNDKNHPSNTGPLYLAQLASGWRRSCGGAPGALRVQPQRGNLCFKVRGGF